MDGAHDALRPRHDESLREFIDRTIVCIMPRVGLAELRAPCLTFLDVGYVYAPHTPVFTQPNAVLWP